MTTEEFYSRLPELIDSIERLGYIWARSGMFRCTRDEQGPAIVSFCMSMGITPMEFIATYDLIGGVPRKKALACLTDLRKRGGRHKWLCSADDREKAIGEFTYDGQTIKVTQTIEDARLQGLVKLDSGWVKTPSNMLRARVITTAIGMLAPEIVAGTDPEDGSMIPPATGLNLTIPTQTASPQAPAPSELEKEAAMGLAPARKVADLEPVAPQPPVPKPPPTTTGKRPKFPAALDPIEPGEEDLVKMATASVAPEEPMPPPTEIGPETPAEEPAPTAPAPTAPLPAAQLDPVVIDTMARIFDGHFLEVANWMVAQGWIPASPKPMNTESAAAAHLQRTLPFLHKTRAKKVLAQKMAFMRAVEEVNP